MASSGEVWVSPITSVGLLSEDSLGGQKAADAHHRQPDRFRRIDGGDVGRHDRVAEAEFPDRLGQVPAQT